MQAKRYQVFISSTYEDLRVERSSVEQTILRGGDIPVGMEAFPAADEEQFEFIKSIIDQCDYYVLIIAGRYGSIASDGLSYTEKEYNYAVSIGVPVLLFIHENTDKLAAGLVEKDPHKIQKLKEFVDRCSEGRVRKSWLTVDGLKLAVKEALDYAKATKSRAGWVRGDSVAKIDALLELAWLRNEYDALKKRVEAESNEIALPDIPAFDASVLLYLEPKGRARAKSSAVKVSTTWKEAFGVFFHSYKSRFTVDSDGEDYFYIDEDEVRDNMGGAIARSFSDAMVTDFKLRQDSLELLVAYYREVGLMSSDVRRQPFTERAKSLGRRQLISGSDGIFSLVSGSFDLDDSIPF